MSGLVAFAKEFLHPGSVSFLVAMLAVGVALAFASLGWGRRWFVAMLAAYWFISTPVGARLLVAPLANPYRAVADPHDADGAGAIVVLGGGIQSVSAGEDTIASLPRAAALRALEGARVFRVLGAKLPVVASGGRAVPTQRRSDAEVIADTLVALQVPRERILLEDQSLTTHDEAGIVTAMLRSRGVRRFVLVTSPTHMTRSLAVFRAEGADVVPSVARAFGDEAEQPRFFVPNGDSLDASDSAIYDYAATLYYWGRGWLAPGGSR